MTTLHLRYPGVLRGGLALVALISLANHTEHFLRLHAHPFAAGQVTARVNMDNGFFGHNTISVDEESVAGGDMQFVQFATLENWRFAKNAPAPCPDGIQKLSGKKLSCVGFMYPLQSGEVVKTFCLLRSTQTCCYGPSPQYNQYILVESAKPVPFERLNPVMVSGEFFPEAKPEDGYIYRMSADLVMPIGEDTPDVDPVKASAQAHLPLFDFKQMAGAKQSNTLPDGLLALDGKTVVVSGYCTSRARNENPPRITLGNVWWDGLAGERPTIFNSVLVSPKNGDQVPPLWKPFQVFTGQLQVTRDPAQWHPQGIVRLTDARLGVPGVTREARTMNREPILPWAFEIGAVFIVAAVSFERRRWRPRSAEARQ